jgi:hypothetical protein
VFFFSNRLGRAGSLLVTREDDEAAVQEVCDDDGDVSSRQIRPTTLSIMRTLPDGQCV